MLILLTRQSFSPTLGVALSMYSPVTPAPSLASQADDAAALFLALQRRHKESNLGLKVHQVIII